MSNWKKISMDPPPEGAKILAADSVSLYIGEVVGKRGKEAQTLVGHIIGEDTLIATVLLALDYWMPADALDREIRGRQSGGKPDMRNGCHTTRGHTPEGYRGNFRRYSVWRNKDDQPLMIDGTAEECAKAMHMTIGSFYSTISRNKRGDRPHKYHIEARWLDEEETED